MKTFVKLIEKEVTKLYPSATITIEKMPRPNNTCLTGLKISEKNRVVIPVIALDELYEEYKQGIKLELIVSRISKLYKEQCNYKFDIDSISFSKLKNNIFLKVLNTNSNEVYLKNILKREFLDLSIVPYVEVVKEGYVNFNSSLCVALGKSEEEIFKIAVKNMKNNCEFSSIVGAINELMCDEQIPSSDDDLKYPMYVLTNKNKVFGASVIYITDFLMSIAEKINSDYFILPSSIHECIIVPTDIVETGNDIYEIQTLKEMVYEVNITHVEQSEILSYSIYYFSRKDNKVILAG